MHRGHLICCPLWLPRLVSPLKTKEKTLGFVSLVSRRTKPSDQNGLHVMSLILKGSKVVKQSKYRTVWYFQQSKKDDHNDVSFFQGRSKSGWFPPASTECTSGLVHTCNLTGTLPATSYFVRVTVVYITGLKSTSSSAGFKTTGEHLSHVRQQDLKTLFRV